MKLSSGAREKTLKKQGITVTNAVFEHFAPLTTMQIKMYIIFYLFIFSFQHLN